ILSKTKFNLYCRLNSRKQREKLGMFIAEGLKCVDDTIHFFTPEAIIVKEDEQDVCERYKEYPVFTVTESEMKQLSQFQSLPSVIAVYKIPEHLEFNRKDFKSGLTLMLDGVQDPGNLGTILRIASWFGVARVVLGSGCADPFNPKAVQASMGAIGMVRFSQEDLLTIIENNPEIPVCGTLLDGTDIYTTPLSLPAFVVMGNEGNGLSEEIRSRVNLPLLIPSFAQGPHAESLNVAAATAITLSEFMRRQSS
ncbi:MAG: RNA methyltransferase, partial [Muribaculaceae bacterium]|nr:RNA methyltransferase [Muribaculaceae bacterium]